MTSIWVIPSNQDHTDEQAFHQITSKHCRKWLSLFEDSQRRARQIFVFISKLSHSLKPYDQSMRGKLHANQPKKSSKTSQNHQRLRNNGSDDCRLIQSTDTAHLQLFQSKPHSLSLSARVRWCSVGGGLQRPVRTMDQMPAQFLWTIVSVSLKGIIWPRTTWPASERSRHCSM